MRAIVPAGVVLVFTVLSAYAFREGAYIGAVIFGFVAVLFAGGTLLSDRYGTKVTLG